MPDIEEFPLERTGKAVRREHLGRTDGQQQGQVLPPRDRDPADHALPAWGAPPGHRDLGTGFIEKDERGRVDVRHLLPPVRAVLLVPFGGDQRFLSETPVRRMARAIVVRLTGGSPGGAVVDATSRTVLPEATI